MSEQDQREEEVNFAVILASADPGDQQERVLDLFSEKFRIQQDQVQKILDRTPIVLFKGLKRNEVSAIKPTLKDLSEDGLSFRVTSAETDALPEVIWPEDWSYSPSYDGELIRELHFDFHGNALVCPECGETLMLKRTGKHLPKTKKTPQVIPKPVEKKKKKQGDEQEKQEEEETKGTETDEDQQFEEDFEEDIDEEEDITFEEEESEMDFEEDTSIDDIELDEDLDEDLDDEEIGDVPSLEMDEGGVDSRDSELVELVEQEGECNVFLQSISNAEVDEQDIKSLLMEVRNCPEDEAKDLMDRPVIPVVKDVDEESAEELLDRFEELGATGNITRSN